MRIATFMYVVEHSTNNENIRNKANFLKTYIVFMILSKARTDKKSKAWDQCRHGSWSPILR